MMQAKSFLFKPALALHLLSLQGSCLQLQLRRAFMVCRFWFVATFAFWALLKGSYALAKKRYFAGLDSQAPPICKLL